MRFGIAINPRKTDPQLFGELPLGDVWAESKCHEVFEYLWACRHVRTLHSYQSCTCADMSQLDPSCRIPDEWKDVLKAFRKDLQQEAFESNRNGLARACCMIEWLQVSRLSQTEEVLTQDLTED